MQLTRPDQLLDPRDHVADALDQARRLLGNRPAVTVLRRDRREEQAVASLAQWAAKGAHLLEADLLLEPGDELLLDAPFSWPAAAVCLAAWWTGITVVVPTGPEGGGDGVDVDGVDGDGADPVEVAICHEGTTPPPEASEVLWLGESVTGAPTDAPGEAWTTAVQAFPDHPPPARAEATRTALRVGTRRHTQAALLDLARQLGTGTAGLTTDRPTATIDAATGLTVLALRPLVTGAPTVVRRGVTADVAAGERVRRWW